MGQKCEICGKPYSLSENLRGALMCTDCERQKKEKKHELLLAESSQIDGEIDIADRIAVISKRASSRYADAYNVAQTVDDIGSIIKVIGVILGVITIVGGFIIATHQEGSLPLTFGGLLLGIVVGVPIFVLGVLVSAQAQILKATLDTAVHSSPFLTKEKMAEIISL